ncbi:MAG: hypothetical protein RSA84_16900 [Acinetobacter sp.]
MAKVIININRLGKGIDVTVQHDVNKEEDALVRHVSADIARGLGLPVLSLVKKSLENSVNKGKKHVH